MLLGHVCASLLNQWENGSCCTVLGFCKGVNEGRWELYKENYGDPLFHSLLKAKKWSLDEGVSRTLIPVEDSIMKRLNTSAKGVHNQTLQLF